MCPMITTMLRSRRVSRERDSAGTPTSHDHPESVELRGARYHWQFFCRDEGRRAAEQFLQRLRAYRDAHEEVSSMPEAAFMREFSESVSTQLASITQKPHSSPSPAHLLNKRDGSRPHWWNIFRRSKSFKQGNSPRANRRTVALGSNDSDLSKEFASGREVIVEQTVNQLNISEMSFDGQLSWFKCHLALVHNQGNHQLEVYSPPKSVIPKMSLFCFLIEDIRSTSQVEVADCNSSFVIKTDHGEYVFDAYTVENKQNWIAKIAQFTNMAGSGSKRPFNGHIPMSASMGALSSDQRPTQGTASRTSNGNGNGNRRAGNLSRSRSQTPTHRATSPLIENLRSSPVVFTLQTPSPTPSPRHAQDDHRAANGTSVLVSPSRSSSVLRETGSGAGARKRAQRNSHAQSMYITGEVPVGLRPLQPSPPFTRRARQAKTASNQPKERPTDLVGGPRRTSLSSATRTPRELLSSPTDIPLPANLECGQSSSSSALHPVSLAAIRSSVSNSDIVEDGDQGADTDTATPTTPIPAPYRKSSAPSVMHHSSQVGDQNSSAHFSSSEALGRVGSEDRLDFVPLAVSAESSSTGGHSRQRSYDSGLSHNTEGAPTSPLATNCYRIDVGSVEHIPTATSGHSSTFSSAGNIHEVTRDTVTSPPSPPTSGASQVADGSSAQATPHPLYIEINGREEVEVATHTQHPYEYWATSPTDVENLRMLSQYPWFHGMISRNNATQLVLSSGTSGSGQYLVRQSESREGDFVLTFNCHNRAKHLRMTLNESGCNIQHLWFENVPIMLEYFKNHPIPLETVPAGEDVTISDYINRSASDGIRTTTIINMERIQRTPPRRSRSIHIAMTQNSTSGDRSGSPSTPRQASGWRQLFSRQRSSSSQSMRSRASVQRSQSDNAGSMMDTGLNHQRHRWSGREQRSENNYT